MRNIVPVLVSNLVSALVGLLAGVLLEDWLKLWRDRLARFVLRFYLFRRLRNRPVKAADALETFHFGGIQTSWIVLDGDGRITYAPETIHCHYDQRALDLPSEIAERKQQIEAEQEDNRSHGLPYLWNGERYALERFHRSRTADEERLVLELWFRPSDYFTFQAAQMGLSDGEAQQVYQRYGDWLTPISYLSNSFGINITLITADHYVVIAQRGKDVGSRPGQFGASANEALSRLLDRGTASYAPDIYRCALRGLTEELGLELSINDIALLSFGVDTRYSQWGILGKAETTLTSAEIKSLRSHGVQDKWEHGSLYLVPFTPQDVVRFVFSHDPWGPAGLACLYHSLISEFGRTSVDDAIRKYEKRGSA